VAAGKNSATRLKAHLVFLNEAGFQLMPSIQRTWAPVGRTPIVRHWTTREKLSVISAISLSPVRRRVGLYYQVHDKNIQQPEVVRFLRHLLRHLQGHVTVLWDCGSPHKGEPIRALLRQHPRLRVESFPPYAPELNPDEGVWRMSKAALANECHDSLETLLWSLTVSLEDLRGSPDHLRACIRHSEVPRLPL
jgi:transposase